MHAHQYHNYRGGRERGRGRGRGRGNEVCFLFLCIARLLLTYGGNTSILSVSWPSSCL